MKTGKLKPLALLLACAAALSACGGGSDDSTTPQPLPPSADGVPAYAKVTASAYASWAAGLPRSEGGVAIDVSMTTPPTSESDPPIGL